MWRNGIWLFSLLPLLLAACLSVPKVPRSAIDPHSSAANSHSPGTAELFRLYETMQGAQSGDAIFKRTTAVYWIIPEIDIMALAVTAREVEFGETEYDARFKRVRDTHDQFLILLIDLRLPFYSGWSQGQLLSYLEQNLMVTLENGSKQIFTPAHQVFHVLERYIEANPVRPPGSSLEVRIPIRVFFERESIITEETSKIILKLRLRDAPPFDVGFFDDKNYQRFEWKIGE